MPDMSGKSYASMADPEIMEDIGRRLRALRGSMDQVEAARRAGLTRQTVSRAERGDNPTLATLLRLLRAYGRVNALDSFVPAPEISPMELLRARRRSRTAGPGSG
jgi:transcriptional regulator with XRE-family HTH domain